MNRIRIGLAITIILGSIYAAAGLFTSLRDFGIGAAIAATAMTGYGLLDFLEAHRNEKLHQYRAEVWLRRDLDALKDSQQWPRSVDRDRDEVA